MITILESMPSYIQVMLRLARQFEEGNVYIIQNFYVKDYIQTAIGCLPNDKQITLTDNTRVTQKDDDGLIEQNVFDLYDLSDVARLKKDDLFLIEQEQDEDAHFEHPTKLIDLRTNMPDFTTEGDITIFPKELLIMEGRKYKVTIGLKEENITKSSTMYTASDIDMVEASPDESAQQQSSPNQAQDNSNVVEATKRTLSPVTNTRGKTSKGKKANNKRKGRKLLLVVSDDEEDNKPSTKLKLPKKEKV
ncbi:hypothetical protein POM88_049445 [Heracleum sosnowskyi]|uniref:Uncharacterized protein n=1 Tax=Heracleum sosnowskyi TaxID=360622 RepID=A0AAD8GXU5_9APIA|nr:hypothetical protein POM88_049445 [Heracleum sosnowskyi]